MRSILDRAQERGGFVRLDMEGSAYTQRTLDFFEQRLYPRYPDTVGIVLQSALRRTWTDVERAIALNCRVRLCKGAYLEPADVAFPYKAEVDRNYVTCMHALMERGRYPGIATHDPEIIRVATAFATDKRDRPLALRIPDAVRRAARPAGAAGARRLPAARLRAVRHAVVSVSHAPPRRASGEPRVHDGQHRAGVRGRPERRGAPARRDARPAPSAGLREGRRDDRRRIRGGACAPGRARGARRHVVQPRRAERFDG